MGSNSNSLKIRCSVDWQNGHFGIAHMHTSAAALTLTAQYSKSQISEIMPGGCELQELAEHLVSIENAFINLKQNELH